MVCGQRAALPNLVLQGKRHTHTPYGSALDATDLQGRLRRRLAGKLDPLGVVDETVEDV